MKKTSLAIIILALTLVGLYGYQATNAQQSGAAEFRAGAVNVTKALLESQEFLDHQKDNDARARAVTDKLATLKTEAESLQSELEQALEPGTDEYQKVLLQFFDKRAAYESYGDSQKQALKTLDQVWMKDFYERLLAQTARIARAEGLALVINLDDRPPQMGEVETMMINRNTLYCAATLDLTARIIEAMDAEYDTAAAQP